MHGYLDKVSPSRLQTLVAEIFRIMLARREDSILRTGLVKKLKGYSKKCQIELADDESQLDDKLLNDLKEREKERSKQESDAYFNCYTPDSLSADNQDEHKSNDLTVISDYLRKMGRKMLNLLINKEGNAVYRKTSADEFDSRLLDGRVPS